MSEGGQAPPAPRPRPRWLPRAAFAAFLIGYAWLYFFLGTHLVHQTNQDRLNWDQQHNIVMSLRGRERTRQPPAPGESVTAALWRALPHYTDGVVNPLWPWIASSFATEDHEAFFLRGKWFNLILTAVFLLALGLVAARVFSYPTAMSLLLAGGLGAMLPRAAYFQPEPVYYVLLFLAWACALALLRRNPLWLYGVLGLLLGLAYLAKTSVQPFLLVFFAVTLLRGAVAWGQGRRAARAAGAPFAEPAWSLPGHFIGLAVLAMAFLAAAGPRLIYAKEAYGAAFHSFPGYWMWMDDFQQGVDFMQRYRNAEALAELPPDEKPSAANYLRSHPWPQTWERLRQGTAKKTREALAPPEWRRSGRELLPFRGWLLGIFAAMLAAMAAMRAWAARRGRPGLAPPGEDGVAWMLLFAGCTTLLSALAFGFYEPIGKGDRFLLSLYLPAALTLLWAAERIRRQLHRAGWGRPADGVFHGLHALAAAAVAWRVAGLVADPVFQR